MRSYRNISDEELAAYGARPDWDHAAAVALAPRSEVLWVDRRRSRAALARPQRDAQVRKVRVVRVDEQLITTTFGSYSALTGQSLRDYGRCCGRLYLID